MRQRENAARKKSDEKLLQTCKSLNLKEIGQVKDFTSVEIP